MLGKKTCQLDPVSGKVLAFKDEHGCLVNGRFAPIDEELTAHDSKAPEHQLLDIVFPHTAEASYSEKAGLEEKWNTFTQNELVYLLSLVEKI